jgi:hypothetical protein
MLTSQAEYLAEQFFRRVWRPPHDLDAIDELMTENYRITTAGQLVEGREVFKAWVANMQKLVRKATNEHLELFTNATGDRVVWRWVTRGFNNGIFGLPPNNEPVEFTGIASGGSKGIGSPNAGWSVARSSFTRGYDPGRVLAGEQSHRHIGHQTPLPRPERRTR